MKKLDKTRRIIEFYPHKRNLFDLVEDDDGISLDITERWYKRLWWKK